VQLSAAAWRIEGEGIKLAKIIIDKYPSHAGTLLNECTKLSHVLRQLSALLD
jgi:hypothetical protein